MNLKQILNKFDEIKDGGGFTLNCYECEGEIKEDAIKQFISTSITKLLEELRMKELELKYSSSIADKNLESGWNACAIELNDKIDKILNV